MTAKTPIRTVFNDSNVATGLAEFQTGEFIAVEHGGTGAVTHTSNAILLGNGTSAIQGSAIGISGTTLSSTDSTLITIDEGLTVTGNTTITGNLTVNGTTTTVNSSTIEVTNSFTFEGSTADAFETTLGVVDPTADRTINLPNASGTLVLQDTTDTLTNKTISGSSNTLSNIANSSLTNSDVTVGSTSISLGATATTIAGLTSLTATTLTDGTASISSGSISSAVNGTFSGTVEAATLTENSVSVATKPFAIAQAVALG